MLMDQADSNIYYLDYGVSLGTGRISRLFVTLEVCGLSYIIIAFL